jgi:hypothetical protein
VHDGLPLGRIQALQELGSLRGDGGRFAHAAGDSIERDRTASDSFPPPGASTGFTNARRSERIRPAGSRLGAVYTGAHDLVAVPVKRGPAFVDTLDPRVEIAVEFAPSAREVERSHVRSAVLRFPIPLEALRAA